MILEAWKRAVRNRPEDSVRTPERSSHLQIHSFTSSFPFLTILFFLSQVRRPFSGSSWVADIDGLEVVRAKVGLRAGELESAPYPVP